MFNHKNGILRYKALVQHFDYSHYSMQHCRDIPKLNEQILVHCALYGGQNFLETNLKTSMDFTILYSRVMWGGKWSYANK